MQKKVILSVVCSVVLGVSSVNGFDLGSVAGAAMNMASQQKSAPKTQTVPSNALLGALTSQLGISNQQAAGGVGSILSYAKTKLPSKDFSTLSKSVPDANSLMALAPKAAGLGGSSLGGMAGLASQFSSLGLNSGMISKFVPILMNYFKSSGSTDAMGILAKLF